MEPFEISSKERELSKSIDTVEEELERAISVTSIDSNDSEWSGTVDRFRIKAHYDWSVEPTDQGSIINESISVNHLGFLALTSILPLIALYSTIFIIGSSNMLPEIITAITGARFGYAMWPFFMLIVIALIASFISLAAMQYMLQLPSPVETQFDQNVVNSDETHAVVGVLILLIMSMIPMSVFVGNITYPSLIPNAQIGETARLSFLLSSFATIIVGYLYQKEQTAPLHYSIGFLYRFNDDNEDTPISYRVVEGKYNTKKLENMEKQIAQAAERVGINIDPELVSDDDGFEVIRGKQSRLGMEATYEWLIRGEGKLDQREFYVQETTYMDRDFTSLIFIMGLSLAALLIIEKFSFVVELISDYPDFYRDLTSLMLLGLAGSSVVLMYLPENLFEPGLDLTDSGGQIKSKRLAINHYVLVMSGVFILGWVWPEDLTPLVPVLAIVVAIMLGTLGLFKFSKYVARLEYDEIVIDTPPPLVEYSQSLAIMATIPATLVFLAPIEQLLPVLWLFGFFTTGWVVWTLLDVKASRELLTALFQSRYNERTNSAVLRLLFYIMAVGLSLFTVYVTTSVAVTIISTGGRGLWKYVIASLLFAPSLFLFCGIFYQVWNSINRLRNLWEGSRVVDPEEYGIRPGLIDAELRIYEGPPGGATGFSTGFRDFVLFTTGDVDVLDEDELAAILAHEDAHASVYFDGVASVIAPILSSVTFTGQNVFFAALEFGRRELRADRYAAETVSEKAIIEALETMRDELVSRRAQNLDSKSSHSTPTAVRFSSFAPDSEDLNWRDEIFGLYFGPHTMTRAHPTIDARIDYIENLAGNETRDL